MAKMDLASKSWCEMVFANRNQAYGAYQLRAELGKRNQIALIVVLALIVIGLLVPLFLKFVIPQKKDDTITEVTNFSKLKEAEVKDQHIKKVQPKQPQQDEIIDIGIAKNQALFELKNCKIVTRLLEGEFLNYNNVIPEDRETRIKVNKAALQGAVERASIFSITASEKEKKYPIKMFVSLGSVIISCTSQVGDAKEEVLVETEGKELEIGF